MDILVNNGILKQTIIKLQNYFAKKDHTHTLDQITDFPTSLNSEIKNCVIELRDDSNSEHECIARNGYFKFCNIKIPNNADCKVAIRVVNLDRYNYFHKYSHDHTTDTWNDGSGVSIYDYAIKISYLVYNVSLFTFSNANGQIQHGSCVSFYNIWNIEYGYITLSDGSVDLYISRYLTEYFMYGRYKLSVDVEVQSRDDIQFTVYDSNTADFEENDILNILPIAESTYWYI